MQISDSQDCSPLAEWLAGFNADAHSLRQLLLLRTRADDYAARDAVEPALSSLAAQISQLEHAMDHLRRHLQSERTHLTQLEEFQRRVGLQTQRIHQIRAHLPPSMESAFSKPPSTMSAPVNAYPESAVPDVSVPDNAAAMAAASESSIKENVPTTGNADTILQLEKDSTRPTRDPITAGKRPPAAPKGKANGTKTKRKQPNNGNPTSVVVRPVTKAELNAAPQYVRGRMTLEKVAAVATRLSEIATSKYSILRRPNHSLNSTELSLCHDFQEANCEETTGLTFLTEAEIKGFGEYRIDSTVKSAINILRHVGILKETRVKGNVRILIIVDTE